jgi:hypothetical protein
MKREKIAAGKEKPSYFSLEGGSKAAKGFAAVTQFVQPDKSGKTAGNCLPAQLKNGVEGLSGVPMDDVKVNYNSAEPAQVGALAYAKGNQIHLGQGQEKHLPHEAWHVVQQKHGRVKPTLQAKGLAINDDPALEAEADTMGQKATQLKTEQQLPVMPLNKSVLLTTDVVQRKIGLEFQAFDSVFIMNLKKHSSDGVLGEGAGFEVEKDSGKHVDFPELEIVTAPVEENNTGRRVLTETMAGVVRFLSNVKNGPLLNEATKKEIKWNIPEKDDAENVQLPLFVINKSIHFHPQATVGVKFEKVEELINHLTVMPFKEGGAVVGDAKEETKAPEGNAKTIEANKIGWSGKTDQRAFKGAWRDGFNKAAIEIGPTEVKARGLAALIYGLLEGQLDERVDPEDSSYIKYWMPFMLRNGFLPFYNAMSAEEKDSIDRLSHPKLSQKFIRKGTKELPDDKIPTFKKILEDLKDGKDYLQDMLVAGHGGIRPTTLASWGMSSIDDIGVSQTEPTANVRKGAIIELRKLANDVPPEQLTEFALAVFDLIMLINARPAPPVPPPPPDDPPAA